MERTKLTIRIDGALLEKAKRYAREQNTTLTRLVSAYLHQLSNQDDILSDAPTVQRLSGILPHDASIETYNEYLERKLLKANPYRDSIKKLVEKTETAPSTPPERDG